MNKKVVMILAIISLCIILFGFLSARSIKNEIDTKGKISGSMYVDGTDMTSLSEAFSEIGSGILEMVVIIFSFLAVAAIWGVYGIVILITILIKKRKKKNPTS